MQHHYHLTIGKIRLMIFRSNWKKKVIFGSYLRYDPNNENDAILVWGDTQGFVTCINFNSAKIALFERPSTTDRNDTNDKEKDGLN